MLILKKTKPWFYDLCEGCEFERIGLKMSVRSNKVRIWLRMEKKEVENKMMENKL